jgi:hypothetical protein
MFAHGQIEILREIPNLRRISICPWANIEEAIAKTGNDYVLSIKPNPAVFAGEMWEPEKIKADITAIFEKTRGCAVELIMKDISTVRNAPRRLWDWARIAAEVAEQF